jgi:type II secretory pathway pseudopilin PulG
LLVVIAIIGVLIGMTIPALQGLREMSRRAACSENLTGLSLALSAYHSQYGHYPAGTVAADGPIRSAPQGFHHNWISGLMPMLDAPNVAAAIDRAAGVYDPANQAVRELQIPFLQCPSAVLELPYQATYAGNQHPDEAPIDEGNLGVFFLNETISNDDIRDGLSYTLFVSEQVQSFGKPRSWMSGTRATLRNAGHAINAHRQTPVNGWGPTFQDPLFVGGFSSQHPQGVQVLEGSGGVRFLSESIDQKILHQMAHRADGQLPLEWQGTDTKAERLPAEAGDTGAADAGEEAAPGANAPPPDGDDAATNKEAA